MEEARAAVQKHLKLDPGFNARKYREYLETLPFANPEDIDIDVERLVKAGLPE